MERVSSSVKSFRPLLAENPNGILIFDDEIVSWLRSMDREGHEADRGFFLTAWAGDSRYTYDRIGRGTTDIEGACVAIVGSSQPGVMENYTRDAVAGGRGDDGLMQRFQLVVWPDPPSSWRNVDCYPDAEAKSQAYAALKHLAELTPLAVDAEHDNFDRDSLPFLRFDSEAQDIFDAWRVDLENRIRSGDEHPAMESHLAKYRSLIPSLALIIHLLDGGKGMIQKDSIDRAVAWGTYLESHARRLYASVTESPAVAARLLAYRIHRGDVADGFAARDVYRMGWSGLDKDRTHAAIDVLLALGWIEERVIETTGRPKTTYAINPKISHSYFEELSKATEAPSGSSGSAESKEYPNFEGGER